MRIVLTVRHAPTGELDAAPLQPEGLVKLTDVELQSFTLNGSAGSVPLGELFACERLPPDTLASSNATSEPQLVIKGDVPWLRRLGTGMTTGLMTVQGSVGHQVGLRLQGGKIHITGNAGDFLGAGLRSGAIQILGNAGDHAGGIQLQWDPWEPQERQPRHGMQGGTIYIRGNCGSFPGAAMRRGLLVVGGDAGDGAGHNLFAGTILIHGKVGACAGLGMRRGTLLFPGATPEILLPTFTRGAVQSPRVLQLLAHTLLNTGWARGAELKSRAWQCYHGEWSRSSKGELFLPAEGSHAYA